METELTPGTIDVLTRKLNFHGTELDGRFSASEVLQFGDAFWLEMEEGDLKMALSLLLATVAVMAEEIAGLENQLIQIAETDEVKLNRSEDNS